MTGEPTHDVAAYYQRITEVDIGEIAREILEGRITLAAADLLKVDCPHHASQSKQSLHIMLDKQGFYCWGCGVGGDVLQLVEFVQCGCVTAGKKRWMPDSHRQARDFLAARVGLPRLGHEGLSPERLAELEAQRQEEVRVFGILTRLAAHYHQQLQRRPDVLAWIASKYGISAETIARLQIGFACHDPWVDTNSVRHDGIPNVLLGDDEHYERSELIATGAFLERHGSLLPFFDGRVVFPYWSRGRVVYLIGRRTEWTPDRPWERSKYRKLPVYHPEKHPEIARSINNSHLFHEDVLLRQPTRVIITEGVADCVALMDHGFPAISPVTVRFREEDWETLPRRLARVGTVYISNDNELSEVGLRGSCDGAMRLVGHGLDARIVELPLAPRQRMAREELQDRFGIRIGMGSQQIKEVLRTHPADREQLERLLDRAKIDACEFFLGGGTAADYETLLAGAKTPLEVSIDRLPLDAPAVERSKALRPVLHAVAGLSPLEQERHFPLIQKRLGKQELSRGVLRAEIREIRRDAGTEKRIQKRRRLRSASDDHPCAAVVMAALYLPGDDSGPPDFARAAEAALAWFVSNGARLFRTRNGEPFMFFGERLLWPDSGDRGRRRIYVSTIYKYTGVVHTTTGGRTFYEVLANNVAQRGTLREPSAWLHTDVSQHTTYFNLNNAEGEIAKISPDGVQILRNGGNAEGIILDDSKKILPLHYLPDADSAEADRLIEQLILDNLTCSPDDGVFVIAWVACFLLLDFAGTRPMVRFEGDSTSGKTTASKILSALVYGEPQQKKSTDAANYTDGSQNPLIVLDNIETKQLTDELATFILTSVTGIVKEKRKGGTDTETVVERTKCLLNTTGVEPLGADLSEILTRSFIIRFRKGERTKDTFLEAEVLSDIRANRDLIISVLMKRTADVLRMLRDGAQRRVMGLLHAALGDHNKRRCNDYLALMYLMSLAGSDEEVERGLHQMRPEFLDRIRSLNEIARASAREANAIAVALAVLFKAHRLAFERDASLPPEFRRDNVDKFQERYQLDFDDDRSLLGVTARELHVALSRVAKDFGQPYGLKSVQQFSQRLSNDLATIKRAGFDITVHEIPGQPNRYDVFELEGPGE